jgi:integrase
MSVEAARLDAAAMKRRIRDGIEPVEQKPEPEPPEPKREPTVRELADDYIEQHAIPHKKPSSVKQDRRMIQTRVLPALGDMKVSAVGKRDVEKVHNSLRDTPYEANRVRSLLSKMFALAIGWDLCEKNPCKGIKKFEEPKHEFWLTEDQLHKLEIALNEYPNQSASDAVRLLMLTGSREGEVLNAEWAQFDLDRGTWTKPSHATKQKKTETVPLSEAALLILRRMEKSKTTIYLFPRSAKLGKVGTNNAAKRLNVATGSVDPAKPAKPRTTVRDCWEMACRKAGLAIESRIRGKRQMLKRWKPTIRINDLRHTFASHLVQRGASLYLVGKLIGHTQAATTQRYAHVADAALRAVTNDFAEVLEMPKPRTA